MQPGDAAAGLSSSCSATAAPYLQVVPAELVLAHANEGAAVLARATHAVVVSRPHAKPVPAWWAAVRILAVMLRNVTVGAAAAWLATYTCSRGNVFVSTASGEQSRTTFMVASMLWTHWSACFFDTIVFSFQLMGRHYDCLDGRRPSFAFCARRLVRGTWMHYAVSAAVIFATGVALGQLPPHLRRYKLEFYVEMVVDQYFFVASEVECLRIFHEETTEGAERARERGVVVTRTSAWFPLRRLVRGYIKSLPLLIALLIAGSYVHIASQWGLSKGVKLNVFVAVSLALKLLMQEVAKRYLLSKGETHIRQMCVIVSVPTVLIDTQVRVLIINLRDVQSTMTASYVVAFLEIAVRFSKALLLRLAIRGKQRTLNREIAKRATTSAHATGYHDKIEREDEDALQVKFAQWRKQIMRLHMAEIYADMYAEYIAIGCSAAIGYIFSNHPQYRVGTEQAMLKGGPSSEINSINPWLIFMQVGIEIGVDFVACVMEILGGIDLNGVGSLGGFLGFLFTMLAVVNINMSAVLYIRSR